MKQSELFYKTRKEAPKEAQNISYKFLLRGDFVAPVSTGIYSFLPLGWRVHRKIEQIIREEMENIGGQEVYLPALISKNLWEETGRWKTIDPPLFKLKDRHRSEFGLGSTHEEIITDLVRKRIFSYKELPFSLFQIQNKFRNEMRAVGGLLRTREFIMKDLYSFHSNERDLISFYAKVKGAYFKIFERCGLKTLCVEASSGTIGGDMSQEFMVVSPVVGEDRVLFCQKCAFGANIEKMEKSKKCPNCRSILEEKKCVEVGHIFNLGVKYSKDMGANFKDSDGKPMPIVMGCYGIGLGRLMSVIIEANNDAKGIIWPPEVSPFDIHLIALYTGKEKKDKIIRKTAESIYKSFGEKIRQNRQLDVLYDDRRDKGAGEKLIEADLIGIPERIVISEKSLEKNSIEVKKRKEQKKKLIKIADIKNYIDKIKKQQSYVK